MTSTQTHKVIMGIRSEHRGILATNRIQVGTLFLHCFSSVFVSWFCAMCKNIAKKKLVLWPVSEKILGKLRINLCFHSIGESGEKF